MRYSGFPQEHQPLDGREVERGIKRLGEDAVEMEMGRARNARKFKDSEVNSYH